MARALAESKDLIVVDEFTSVVDRTVAKIGSAAISRSVKRANKKFIAVSCHYDICEWLEPDWIYEPSTNNFSRRLLRRPKINLEIFKTGRKTWEIFSKYHYLNHSIGDAEYFCAFYEGIPIAMTSAIPFPHPVAPGYREHRLVCLPDYQGVGIGNALSSFIASCYIAKGRPYYSATSNQAIIRHRAKSKQWQMIRLPSLAKPQERKGLEATKGKKSERPDMAATAATDRMIASFKYVGTPDIKSARILGIVK
jgi:GNAT superfamily N-acetyltransferase